MIGQASPAYVDMGFRIMDPIHLSFLDSRSSQTLRGETRRSQKFQPTFKIGSNTQLANKLLIKIILIDRSNPWFHPSLKDFTDNSDKNLLPWLMFHLRLWRTLVDSCDCLEQSLLHWKVYDITVTWPNTLWNLCPVTIPLFNNIKISPNDAQ